MNLSLIGFFTFSVVVFSNFIFISLMFFLILGQKKKIISAQKKLTETLEELDETFREFKNTLNEFTRIEKKYKQSLENAKHENSKIRKEILENIALKRKLMTVKEFNLKTTNAPKLSDYDKKEIAHMYSAGYTQKELAEKYKVSQSLISKAIQDYMSKH